MDWMVSELSIWGGVPELSMGADIADRLWIGLTSTAPLPAI